LEIRRLTPDDAPVYRALRLRALREHPEAFTSSFEEESVRPMEDSAKRLAGGDTKFWGAWEGASLGGVVGLEREKRMKNRHKAVVVGMYVAPEKAGSGVGKRLVDAVVHEAKRDGIELLLLTVTEGNESATALYRHAGFRSFGIEPRAIRVEGRYYNKDHMVMDLGQPR
jgi:ribosomal protein S18 acetylase RimI-like enzyme